MSCTFMGYATFEDMGDPGTVVMFTSDYKSKDSVLRNVSRCVSKHVGGDYVATDVVIFDPDGNEALCEAVKDIHEDTGFHVLPKLVNVTKPRKSASNVVSIAGDADDSNCVAEFASEYGADPETVLELLDCWMLAVGGRSYEEELPAFREAFDALHGGKAVA